MFELTEIDRNDLELMRVLKNSHRAFFFDSRKINKARQRYWFDRSYSKSTEVKVYKILSKGKIRGIFGVYFRSTNELELFNLIVVRKNRKRGLFSIVIKNFCSDQVKRGMKCFVKVLHINPAINWYTANGFVIVKSEDDYVVMEYVND